MGDSAALPRRLVTLLSPPSHYFTTLWPVIVAQADKRTQRLLGNTCAQWFHTLVLEATIKQRSDRLKDFYVEGDQHPPGRSSGETFPGGRFACPNPLRLRNNAVLPVWYEWGY